MTAASIFVTGATGVLGRRVIPALVRANHTVTAVARSQEKADALRVQGADPVNLDLFNPLAVRRAVQGHDIIINLATHIPPSSRAFLPGAFRQNNRIRREVSANLVSAALDATASRFIQESISLSYPDAGEQWIDEDFPIQPPKYARSVLDSETNAQLFALIREAGVILRFSMFYGPDSSHTIDTVNFVRKGKAPTFGSRHGFISSVSTDDAASAVIAALGVPSGAYNVTDDRPVHREEYFNSLAAALGVPAPWIPPEWVKKLFGSLGETIARSQRVSNARFASASGWRPQFPSVADAWPTVLQQMSAMPDGAGSPL